ncbi:Tyrosine kinase-like (TKL) protein [Toxoplasma gondii CAST]|uniref:Tyrosine kinase-like (TKL) protein n=1 Tax=Toxoplasma gondii CAST TaxID=943122 RepID=A0A3R8AJG1_TOXGO|nr:Tyrosine kinase-like (TKL) protein [Toxoplasma gondii CAST]
MPRNLPRGRERGQPPETSSPEESLSSSSSSCRSFAASPGSSFTSAVSSASASLASLRPSLFLRGRKRSVSPLEKRGRASSESPFACPRSPPDSSRRSSGEDFTCSARQGVGLLTRTHFRGYPVQCSALGIESEGERVGSLCAFRDSRGEDANSAAPGARRSRGQEEREPDREEGRERRPCTSVAFSQGPGDRGDLSPLSDRADTGLDCGQDSERADTGECFSPDGPLTRRVSLRDPPAWRDSREEALHPPVPDLFPGTFVPAPGGGRLVSPASGLSEPRGSIGEESEGADLEEHPIQPEGDHVRRTARGDQCRGRAGAASHPSPASSSSRPFVEEREDVCAEALISKMFSSRSQLLVPKLPVERPSRRLRTDPPRPVSERRSFLSRLFSSFSSSSTHSAVPSALPSLPSSFSFSSLPSSSSPLPPSPSGPVCAMRPEIERLHSDRSTSSVCSSPPSRVLSARNSRDFCAGSDRLLGWPGCERVAFSPSLNGGPAQGGGPRHSPSFPAPSLSSQTHQREPQARRNAPFSLMPTSFLPFASALYQRTSGQAAPRSLDLATNCPGAYPSPGASPPPGASGWQSQGSASLAWFMLSEVVVKALTVHDTGGVNVEVAIDPKNPFLLQGTVTGALSYARGGNGSRRQRSCSFQHGDVATPVERRAPRRSWTTADTPGPSPGASEPRGPGEDGGRTLSRSFQNRHQFAAASTPSRAAAAPLAKSSSMPGDRDEHDSSKRPPASTAPSSWVASLRSASFIGGSKLKRQEGGQGLAISSPAQKRGSSANSTFSDGECRTPPPPPLRATPSRGSRSGEGPFWSPFGAAESAGRETAASSRGEAREGAPIRRGRTGELNSPSSISNRFPFRAFSAVSSASLCRSGGPAARGAPHATYYYFGETKRNKRHGWGMIVNDERCLLEAQWVNDTVLGWYVCYHEYATEFGYRELTNVSAVSVASDSNSFIIPVRPSPTDAGDAPLRPLERSDRSKRDKLSTSPWKGGKPAWGRTGRRSSTIAGVAQPKEHKIAGSKSDSDSIALSQSFTPDPSNSTFFLSSPVPSANKLSSGGAPNASDDPAARDRDAALPARPVSPTVGTALASSSPTGSSLPASPPPRASLGGSATGALAEAAKRRGRLMAHAHFADDPEQTDKVLSQVRRGKLKHKTIHSQTAFTITVTHFEALAETGAQVDAGGARRGDGFESGLAAAPELEGTARSSTGPVVPSRPRSASADHVLVTHTLVRAKKNGLDVERPRSGPIAGASRRVSVASPAAVAAAQAAAEVEAMGGPYAAADSGPFDRAEKETAWTQGGPTHSSVVDGASRSVSPSALRREQEPQRPTPDDLPSSASPTTGLPPSSSAASASGPLAVCATSQSSVASAALVGLSSASTSQSGVDNSTWGGRWKLGDLLGHGNELSAYSSQREDVSELDDESLSRESPVPPALSVLQGAQPLSAARGQETGSGLEKKREAPEEASETGKDVATENASLMFLHPLPQSRSCSGSSSRSLSRSSGPGTTGTEAPSAEAPDPEMSQEEASEAASPFQRRRRRPLTCIPYEASAAANKVMLDLTDAEAREGGAGERSDEAEGRRVSNSSANAVSAEELERRKRRLRRGSTFPEFTTQENPAVTETVLCEGINRGGTRPCMRDPHFGAGPPPCHYLRASDSTKWSTNTFCHFLRMLGLTREASIAKLNRLCGADIPTLTREKLRETGITDRYIHKFLLTVARCLWSCSDHLDPLTPLNRRHLRRSTFASKQNAKGTERPAQASSASTTSLASEDGLRSIPASEVRVGRKLGGGGYATVYKARYRGRDVACKIFKYTPSAWHESVKSDSRDAASSRQTPTAKDLATGPVPRRGPEAQASRPQGGSGGRPLDSCTSPAQSRRSSDRVDVPPSSSQRQEPTAAPAGSKCEPGAVVSRANSLTYSGARGVLEVHPRRTSNVLSSGLQSARSEESVPQTDGETRLKHRAQLEKSCDECRADSPLLGLEASCGSRFSSELGEEDLTRQPSPLAATTGQEGRVDHRRSSSCMQLVAAKISTFDHNGGHASWYTHSGSRLPHESPDWLGEDGDGGEEWEDDGASGGPHAHERDEASRLARPSVSSEPALLSSRVWRNPSDPSDVSRRSSASCLPPVPCVEEVERRPSGTSGFETRSLSGASNSLRNAQAAPRSGAGERAACELSELAGSEGGAESRQSDNAGSEAELTRQETHATQDEEDSQKASASRATGRPCPETQGRVVPKLDYFRYCPQPLKHRDYEADILAALQPHPNIISLYGRCHLRPGEEALIIEYCKKGSLDALVFPRENERRGGPKLWKALSRPKLVQIFIDVAKGMAHVHSRNILHRDLKLSNILLDGDTGKVADFGVATAFVPSDSPSVLALFGNLFYAAPEVLRGDAFYPASDVWSYGVAFWEALTGTLAYEGFPAGFVFTRVAAGALGLHIPSDFPPPLRFLMSRILAFEPSERPSFEEVAQALTDLQANALSEIERDLDDFFGLA